MNIKRRILLTCAFLAVVAASMALRPAPTCAIGDIHIIIIRSTTDPALRQAGEYWQFTIESLLRDSMGHMVGTRGAFDPSFGVMDLGRDAVATYEVLEGQETDPYNIAAVCRDVSQKAGPDDAIMVFVLSYAAMLPGNNGEDRHVLYPAATSFASAGKSTGLPRGTILKNLKTKPHRLIALITDTYEEPIPSDDEVLPNVSKRPAEIVERITAPQPKDTPYLKRFLQEAHGELNVGSHNPGLAAAGPVGLTFAFIIEEVAQNGLYLESEINPVDFYEHLRFARTHGDLYDTNSGVQLRNNELTRYNGNQRVESSPPPYATLRTMKDFCNERKEKLLASGEFDTRELEICGSDRDFFNGTYPEPVVVDDSDSDFVPAVDDSDSDFVPADGDAKIVPLPAGQKGLSF
ncbi:MAG: hypothetical protein IJL92_02520 [Thermoguttaceae bacterium]|nr:hypothetical protein [Thermoguttaceae bacterium]